MKKLYAILLLLMLTSTGAFAFVDNRYMITGQFLHNTGYSNEVERMVNVTARDPYGKVPDKKDENIFKRIHNYLIPGTYTDLDFYDHDIDANNPNFRDL